MKQNPIDEVLKELQFTESEKKGFWEFLMYAKSCQETGNNANLKSYLETLVKNITSQESKKK